MTPESGLLSACDVVPVPDDDEQAVAATPSATAASAGRIERMDGYLATRTYAGRAGLVTLAS
jgi:hypothetical protein